MTRPSWDEYFMHITREVAKRSMCLRRRVGAVIVQDKRILTTGYNGPPRDLKHCTDVGCVRQNMGIPSGERTELCRGLHAEQNAIIQAALHGVRIAGSDIYITLQPCVLCAKMLINAGIQRIVYDGDYPDDLSRRMLDEADIELVRFVDGFETMSR